MSSLIKNPRSKLKIIFLVLLNTFLILLVMNFLIVKFSPVLFNQNVFPRAFLNHIDGCYKTFYPNLSDQSLENYNAILGDSYAEGRGDEFLIRSYDYSIGHYLKTRNDINYLNFARSGFGSVRSVAELLFCMRMRNNSFLLDDIANPNKVFFFFYEGNDLNNNQYFLNKFQSSKNVSDTINQSLLPQMIEERSFSIKFPLFSLIKNVVSDYWLNSRQKYPSKSEAVSFKNYIQLKDRKFHYPINVQAAAVELSEVELRESLNVFYESLLSLKKEFPKVEVQIIYIPTMVTIYKWTNDNEIVQIKSHTGFPFTTTTSKENEAKSLMIRSEIKAFADRRHFDFVDPTKQLQEAAQSEVLHGPIDWYHFNKIGLEVFSRAILDNKN